MGQIKRSGFWADLVNLLNFQKVWREPNPSRPSIGRHHVRIVTERCDDPDCRLRHFDLVEGG